MMKLMFSLPHPLFQEPSSSISFHYHSPYSSGNSSPFQQILFHQNHLTAERKGNPRIRFLSAMCYKHHPLQRIILHGLPIKENITSKQLMFYRSYFILMNWKAARKTKVWHFLKAFALKTSGKGELNWTPPPSRFRVKILPKSPIVWGLDFRGQNHFVKD